MATERKLVTIALPALLAVHLVVITGAAATFWRWLGDLDYVLLAVAGVGLLAAHVAGLRRLMASRKSSPHPAAADPAE